MRIFCKLGEKYDELDLYSSERVSTTFTFDSLNNPSSIISDYSDSFSVPRTQNNNKIFDEFIHFDSITSDYQPNVFIDCIITNNSNQPIIVGQCYVSKINKTDYTLEVSGTLYSIFKKIKAIDFDKPLRMHKVSGELVETGIPNVLTRSNVAWSYINSLRNDSSLIPTGLEITDTDKYLEGYVGWAMCNDDEYEDFESSKWLTHNIFNNSIGGEWGSFGISSNMQILDNLRDGNFTDMEVDEDGSTLIDGDTYNVYLKDKYVNYRESDVFDLEGTEHNMQEFRSYYQHPYLKLKKWADYIADEIKTETGYEISYEDGLIEDEAIYLLKRFYNGESTDVINSESVDFNIDRGSDVILVDWFNEHKSNANVGILPHVSASASGFSVSPENTDEITIDVRLSLSGYDGSGYMYAGYINPLLINVTTKGQPCKVCLIVKNANDTNDTDATWLNYYGDLGYQLQYVEYEYFNDIEFSIKTKVNGLIGNSSKEQMNNYDINVDIQLANLEKPYLFNGHYYGSFGMSLESVTATRVTRKSSRSGKEITIENLLQGENMFDILIGYTKLKHGIWVVDDVNKTIKVQKCENYLTDVFYQKNSLDVTDNIDYSSIEQYPIAWESEVVRMKHTDTDEIADYDTKLITTPNHISTNTDPEDIFEQTSVCLMSQKTGMVFDVINGEKNEKSNYILPYVEDGNSGFYGFANWSNPDQHKFTMDSRVRCVYSKVDTKSFFITDDSKVELDTDVYCWHSENLNGVELGDLHFESDENRVLYHKQGSSVPRPISSLEYKCSAIITARRPYITDYNVDGDSVLYTRPELYLYDRIGDSRTTFVYDRYEGYIGQLYNQNNRKLECTAKITYNEWQRIKTNPIVFLEDCIFIVTSLEYWNDNDCLCKMILRKISNIFDIVDKSKDPSGENITITVVGGDNCYCTEFEKTVKKGEKVNMNCVPDTDYRFVGWYDANDKLISTYSSWTMTASEDITLHPVCEEIPSDYYGWRISADNALILCDWGSNVRLPKDTEVTASVIASSGYVFVHWYDIDNDVIFSTENQITVMMNRNYNLKAVTSTDAGEFTKEISTNNDKIQITIS